MAISNESCLIPSSCPEAFAKRLESLYASQRIDKSQLSKTLSDICLEPVNIDVKKMIDSVVAQKSVVPEEATSLEGRKSSVSIDLFAIQTPADPFFDMGQAETASFLQSLALKN